MYSTYPTLSKSFTPAATVEVGAAPTYDELVTALRLIEHATAPGFDNGHHENAHDLATQVLTRLPAGEVATLPIECHGLDTPERVCFYEQDFYVLSNFSAFRVRWNGFDFDTSEAAYHWAKFWHNGERAEDIRYAIRGARSAHEAFKIAEQNKAYRRADWDEAKVGVMLMILREKAQQHEYVRRKLLATGDRELVENSWRDDFWGWGPNRDGQNMLGKLWMQVRAELRHADEVASRHAAAAPWIA